MFKDAAWREMDVVKTDFSNQYMRKACKIDNVTVRFLVILSSLIRTAKLPSLPPS